MGKDKLITLDDFNVNSLAEIQGKKELQIQLVKDNPFIEVTDNASWEIAKKSRTALRTGRTDLEKEKKMVISKVKEKITEPINKTYDELIAITSPEEEKQQVEVKRYEDIKENERLERERIENERKEKHRTAIDAFFVSTKQQIESLTFETAKTFEFEIKVDGKNVTTEHFEEFQDLFDGKLEVLKVQLADKKTLLQDRENIRIEQERLADLRMEQERVERIKISIHNYFTYWLNLSISSLSFENITSFKKMFDEAILIDCQELQPLFDEKRAELVEAIESRVNFLQEFEQLRIEREAVAKQKQENLITARTNELISLGFDKDAAYDTIKFKMIVSTDDLLCGESEWADFITETKERIRIANIPVVEPEIITTEAEIVSTEAEIVSTEAETVSTEAETVSTEAETVTTVGPREEVISTEPKRETLQYLIEDFIKECDDKDVVKMYDFMIELIIKNESNG